MRGLLHRQELEHSPCAAWPRSQHGRKQELERSERKKKLDRRDVEKEGRREGQWVQRQRAKDSLPSGLTEESPLRELQAVRIAHLCVMKTENQNEAYTLSLQSVQVKKLDACRVHSAVGTHIPPTCVRCPLNPDFHLGKYSTSNHRPPVRALLGETQSCPPPRPSNTAGDMYLFPSPLC